MELILRRQKNPIYVIMSCKFTGIILLEGGRPRSEGSKQTEAGGPKEGAPRGPMEKIACRKKINFFF